MGSGAGKTWMKDGLKAERGFNLWRPRFHARGGGPSRRSRSTVDRPAQPGPALVAAVLGHSQIGPDVRVCCCCCCCWRFAPRRRRHHQCGIVLCAARALGSSRPSHLWDLASHRPAAATQTCTLVPFRPRLHKGTRRLRSAARLLGPARRCSTLVPYYVPPLADGGTDDETRLRPNGPGDERQQSTLAREAGVFGAMAAGGWQNGTPTHAHTTPDAHSHHPHHRRHHSRRYVPHACMYFQVRPPLLPHHPSRRRRRYDGPRGRWLIANWLLAACRRLLSRPVASGSHDLNGLVHGLLRSAPCLVRHIPSCYYWAYYMRCVWMREEDEKRGGGQKFHVPSSPSRAVRERRAYFFSRQEWHLRDARPPSGGSWHQTAPLCVTSAGPGMPDSPRLGPAETRLSPARSGRWAPRIMSASPLFWDCRGEPSGTHPSRK